MRQKIDSDGVGKRVKELISFKNMSDSMFAKKVGIDTGNFNKKINGKQPWSINDINKICEKHMVRRQWLEYGEGDMFKTINEIVIDKNQNETDEKSELTKPRLPVSCAAGQLSEYIDSVIAYHCEQMPIIRRFPDYDFTMFIRGNSMEPKYEGGDEIALKKATIIEWGKDYVIDTNEGVIFKKIYDAGENIRCVSYNRNEYPDFLIPKSSIYGYYKFVGLVRI